MSSSVLLCVENHNNFRKMKGRAIHSTLTSMIPEHGKNLPLGFLQGCNFHKVNTTMYLNLVIVSGFPLWAGTFSQALKKKKAAAGKKGAPSDAVKAAAAEVNPSIWRGW